MHRAKEEIVLAKPATGGDGDEHAFHDIARVEDGRVIPTEFDEKSLDAEFDRDIANDAYRPYLVLQTAQRVLLHLEEDKPRKYAGFLLLSSFISSAANACIA